MALIKLSSPWINYYHEVEALFKYDSQVHVIFDEEGQVLFLYVDNSSKAEALSNLFPGSITFGNMTIDINVISTNQNASYTYDNIWKAAFDGNRAFAFTRVVKGVFADDITYVVFKNCVVQYFTDDLGDIYGQRSTLYQEIAKDLFGEHQGIFFCTDIKGKVDENEVIMPLYNWP